ncbi:MAG: EAL domain-containing protein [Alphaproteobacteria bacterium]|nr:EAL domain-containing protein [Alphaproteobacteria bacterium]
MQPTVDRLAEAAGVVEACGLAVENREFMADTARIGDAGRATRAQFERVLAAMPSVLTGEIAMAPLRHDLRTPLNAARGYSELLLEEDALPPVLVDATRRVCDLVNALLLDIDQHLANPVVLESEPGEAEDDTPQVQQEPATILVVDDNEDTRLLISRRIERDGHKALSAPDGETALAAMAIRDIDLVLLDLDMPGVSGSDVLLRLKTSPATSRIPVVMISADADVSRVVQCLEFGAEDYVTKPFNPVLLRARIGAALEKYRLRMRDEASWEDRFRTLMNMFADGVVVLDERGLIETGNATASALTGLTGTAMVGENIKRFLPDVDGRPDQWVRGVRGSVFDTRCQPATGESIPVEVTVSEVWYDERRRFAAVIRDISARKAAEARNAYLARYDPNTDLLNETALREDLDTRLAENREGTLMMISFANNRQLEEDLRQTEMATLARQVADRLRRLASPGDVQGRLSSGEYAWICHSEIIGETLGERVLAVLSEPFPISGHEVLAEPHIGFTCFPADGTTAVRLLRNADLALDHARRDRGWPMKRYTETMWSAIQARRTLERDLRIAIDRGELEVWFQPKVELKTRRCIGAEALVRWNHPDHGIISPASFMPVAEESNLILPIGAIVLQKSCAEAARWRKHGLTELHIAVNISATQFKRQNLPLLLRAACHTYGIPASILEFEVTERVLMDDTREATRTLNALRDEGVALAIDDFGTGYSSLAYLHRMPVTTLKVDQSFVRPLMTDTSTQAITRTIIGLAESMKLRCVAEGVETEDEHDWLALNSCCYGQGWLYGRPMRGDAFMTHVTANV